MKWTSLVVSCAVALLGCRSARDPEAPDYGPHGNSVLIAASGDLDCAQTDINVSEMEDGRYLAEGCGNLKMYEISCTSSRQNPSEHCSARPVASPESSDEDADEAPAEAVETDDE